MSTTPSACRKSSAPPKKRAIEIARYVLPVAAFTTMVHTISGIVLHRLWRMSAASDTPSEARAVIAEMVSQVKAIDAQFFDRFGIESLEELPEWKKRYGAAVRRRSLRPRIRCQAPRQNFPPRRLFPPTPSASWLNLIAPSPA